MDALAREIVDLAMLLSRETHPGEVDRLGFSIGDAAAARQLAKMVLADPSDQRNLKLLAHFVGLRYADQIKRRFWDRKPVVESARRIAYPSFTAQDRERIARTIVFEKTKIGGFDGWRIHAQNARPFTENSWWKPKIHPRFQRPNVMTTLDSGGRYARSVLTSGRGGRNVFDVIETTRDLTPTI